MMVGRDDPPYNYPPTRRGRFTPPPSCHPREPPVIPAKAGTSRHHPEFPASAGMTAANAASPLPGLSPAFKKMTRSGGVVPKGDLEPWRLRARKPGWRSSSVAARPDVPPGVQPRAAPDPPPGRALHAPPRVGRCPRLCAPTMKMSNSTRRSIEVPVTAASRQSAKSTGGALMSAPGCRPDKCSCAFAIICAGYEFVKIFDNPL